MSYDNADMIDAGADYIETNGWYGATGGEDLTDKQSACATNAIWWAAGGTDDAIDAIDALTRSLGFENRIRSTWKWNDAPERTKNEVLDAMRSAAKQERITGDQA